MPTRPPHPAQLYTGQYFQLCLAAARTLTGGDDTRIHIVSALHGLLSLTEQVEPYDVQLPRASAAAIERLAAVVRAQAHDAGLLERPVAVLGGRAYVQVVREVWPHATAPLAGLEAWDFTAGSSRASSAHAGAPRHPAPPNLHRISMAREIWQWRTTHSAPRTVS
ncbi:hypothetical protein OHB26_38745 (plasmid) [Nocardia sp. NBC_01503]|uniref:DUF6884 domain-containing protein n=1 Tax=Nocardia sp. NBC_01503 TaxID=2975997 RepID=UPI002E7AAF6E|nr:DUF6884 domain-containing protein [Nocardia sp. NBC_01503]WTL36617.1 hypothetical protein OHB26_38745 [Nocardia sp. NBC_01503]